MIHICLILFLMLTNFNDITLYIALLYWIFFYETYISFHLLIFFYDLIIHLVYSALFCIFIFLYYWRFICIYTHFSSWIKKKREIENINLKFILTKDIFNIIFNGNKCNFERRMQVRNVIIKFILMKYMHI